MPKFIHTGVKRGIGDTPGTDDGNSYYYGIDSKGVYWISRINTNSMGVPTNERKKWILNKGTIGEIEVKSFSADDILKNTPEVTLQITSPKKPMEF